jgi:hypothetical protein
MARTGALFVFESGGVCFGQCVYRLGTKMVCRSIVTNDYPLGLLAAVYVQKLAIIDA